MFLLPFSNFYNWKNGNSQSRKRFKVHIILTVYKHKHERWFSVFYTKSQYSSSKLLISYAIHLRRNIYSEIIDGDKVFKKKN